MGETWKFKVSEQQALDFCFSLLKTVPDLTVSSLSEARRSPTKIKTNMLSRQHTGTSNTDRQQLTHTNKNKEYNGKKNNKKRQHEADSNCSHCLCLSALEIR